MTPVEELFQLLWDTPQDKLTWFAIRKRMLEKEKAVITDAYESGQKKQKEVIMDAYESGQTSFWSDDMGLMGDWYYNETFNTKEK